MDFIDDKFDFFKKRIVVNFCLNCLHLLITIKKVYFPILADPGSPLNIEAPLSTQHILLNPSDRLQTHSLRVLPPAFGILPGKIPDDT